MLNTKRTAYFSEAGFARLPLARGQWAVVDGDFAGRVSKHLWSLDGNGYPTAHVAGPNSSMVLHRFIVKTDAKRVDHIDGNKLDARKQNLRPATPSLNGLNRLAPNKNSKSGIRGVIQRGNRYLALIKINRKPIFLGSFPTAELAARAYSTALKAATSD